MRKRPSLGQPISGPVGGHRNHELAVLDDAWYQDAILYMRRAKKGVQSPDETLRSRRGSCRDFAVLIMETSLISSKGKVIWLSKIQRLKDVFARRLQVQKRLTTQIAEAIENAIKPRGVGGSR